MKPSRSTLPSSSWLVATVVPWLTERTSSLVRAELVEDLRDAGEEALGRIARRRRRLRGRERAGRLVEGDDVGERATGVDADPQPPCDSVNGGRRRVVPGKRCQRPLGHSSTAIRSARARRAASAGAPRGGPAWFAVRRGGVAALHHVRRLPADRGPRTRGRGAPARAPGARCRADRSRRGPARARRAGVRRTRRRRGRARRPGRAAPRTGAHRVLRDGRREHRAVHGRPVPLAISRTSRYRSSRRPRATASAGCAAVASTWCSRSTRPLAPDLDVVTLFDDPFRLALPATHPLARAADLRLADLGGERWIDVPAEVAGGGVLARTARRARRQVPDRARERRLHGDPRDGGRRARASRCCPTSRCSRRIRTSCCASLGPDAPTRTHPGGHPARGPALTGGLGRARRAARIRAAARDSRRRALGTEPVPRHVVRVGQRRPIGAERRNRELRRTVQREVGRGSARAARRTSRHARRRCTRRDSDARARRRSRSRDRAACRTGSTGCRARARRSRAGSLRRTPAPVVPGRDPARGPTSRGRRRARTTPSPPWSPSRRTRGSRRTPPSPCQIQIGNRSGAKSCGRGVAR